MHLRRALRRILRLCPSSLLTRHSHDAAAGIIGGATALVAAPALGAREEGAVGFLKGLGAGAFQVLRVVYSRRPTRAYA